MTNPWPSRRATATVRKGDARERQILDAAENLLSASSYGELTVADIAEAAGITRSALYFYFGSKQEVLTALVARTVQHLQDDVQSLRDTPGSARGTTETVENTIDMALESTVQLWRRHGPVMRMAVDLATAVPDIDQLWAGTAEVSIEVITDVLCRGGVPLGAGAGDAPALARALCWMIERSFYQASKTSTEALDDAKQTCQAVWMHIVVPREPLVDNSPRTRTCRGAGLTS
ncbi:TetR/AcrR family transcriptional regulator [Mycolicibacterium nivoides]|uniref:TetR/AcrR family transcriptional regulator n=1 Tax=Mycolicibacterium nivoides TaxID=2487344 RepID=A0ABW9LNY1_9MYCO